MVTCSGADDDRTKTIGRPWRSRWPRRFRRPASSVCWKKLIALHGRPAAVRVDNGPELLPQVFVDWCSARGIVVKYIQPGKPDQNAYIERFNRSYRTEILDAYLFESLAEVRALTERRLLTYNRERPHDSRVPPLTFLPRPTSPGKSTFALST